ncbi:MAG: 4'-phosphopantetheinyl transferase superfamily protein [archaeon]|nr:4'-phosphopantetheinyl transferase superfamily protein [archaeon]
MTECLLIDCRGCTPEQYQGILSLIPQERRELAESYRHFSDKVMSAVSGLCQELVKLRCGCEVYIDGDRKPQCSDGKHHFNISHSGLFVGVAFSDYPVGFDVQETITEPTVFPAICSPEEHLQLGCDPSPETVTMIWCRKESYLKLIGTGIRPGGKTLNALGTDFLPKDYGFTEGSNDVVSYCTCSSDGCRFLNLGLEELCDLVDPRFTPYRR